MPKNHLASVSFVCPSMTLTTLNLEQCRLTLLPDNICDFSNLQTLALSNNQIACLPEAILKLRHLSFLQLANNTLQSLPQEIGDLSGLTRLDVRGNMLRKLPPSIWRFQNLLFLNASSNFLEYIPLPLAPHEKDPPLGLCLKVLQLGDNKMANIHGTSFKAISLLQELVSLNLSFNSITDVSLMILSLSPSSFLSF